MRHLWCKDGGNSMDDFPEDGFLNQSEGFRPMETSPSLSQSSYQAQMCQLKQNEEFKDYGHGGREDFKEFKGEDYIKMEEEDGRDSVSPLSDSKLVPGSLYN